MLVNLTYILMICGRTLDWLRARGDFQVNKGEGRRSNLDIIADILDASHRRVKKTRLMQNSNMSFAQLQKYLDLILNARLLFVENVGHIFCSKFQVKAKAFRTLMRV
jgi:predicted transcriptional regulator